MKKLCVIFGGPSVEHDISIITGLQLSKNIMEIYPHHKIYYGLDNKLYLADKALQPSFFANKQKVKLQQVVIIDGTLYLFGKKLKKLAEVECVINCCHGGAGECGDLAGYFDVCGVKYTSANALSSHIAMDKSLAKALLKDIVPTIDGVKVTKQNLDLVKSKIDKELSKQLVVKPNALGSSIGVKACNKLNYVEHINAIFAMEDDALVENRIVNIIEYNQACLRANGGLILSAIEQPIKNSDILSFDDKYVNNQKSKFKDRIIPANIDSELEEKIISYTSKIYEALNMNGVVRIDYIYDTQTKTLYFNEVNTIPGSMAYYLFEPVGLDNISLIEILINNASKPTSYKYFDTQILKDKKI